MAVFNEVGEGGVSLAGCSHFYFAKIFATKFGPRDVVFSKCKALRGVLEKIVIKKHKALNTTGVFSVMYQDTFNALWNEEDLISHTEAIEFAAAHFERLLAEAARIKDC